MPGLRDQNVQHIWITSSHRYAPPTMTPIVPPRRHHGAVSGDNHSALDLARMMARPRHARLGVGTDASSSVERPVAQTRPFGPAGVDRER